VKRVAAVLAAVALVVVAFLVRDQGDGDGDGPAQATGPVICADDLAEICRAADLEVVEEVAGDTADRLLAEGGELRGRAWVTTSAWARLVVDERERLGLAPTFELLDGRLVSSPVSISIWSDIAAALPCPAPSWRCLAETREVAGAAVRTLSPPVESATGLVVAASQAADLLGRADYSAGDFDFDPDFRLLQPAFGRSASQPLTAMRTRGYGEATAAGTVGADARSTTSTFGSITSLAPAIAVRADVVVLVPAGGDLDDDDRAALAGALLDAGWEPPARGPDGLPGGSVLAALRTLWAEAG